jgi:hypothetical protein
LSKDRSRGLNPRPPGCSTEGVAPLHTAPPVPVRKLQHEVYCTERQEAFYVLERSFMYGTLQFPVDFY